MTKTRNINVITSIILYSIFLIGVVSSILFTQDIGHDITLNIFIIIYYAMMVLIPLSIAISIAYLIIYKSKKDIICLCASILSTSWIIVVMYVVGDVLSSF